jgi:TonB family protein
VKDFAFAEPTPRLVPGHRRSTLVIAAVIHAAIAAVVIQIATQPVRVSSVGSPGGRIAAYVAGPASAAPAVKPKPPQPKTALKTEAAKDTPTDDQSASAAVGSAGVLGADQTGGPVRLGSSGNLTLLKRVQPVYPPMMQRVRATGTVVLDAIIHADGTIGEVTVLQSTNAAFAQSAVDAVKQWVYTPIGFEAILTVTVNFTLT